MRNLIAIFRKQCKDTLKNKTIFIQFVMFPVLTLVMSSAIKIEGMPENFFVNLFATMYTGMAPLTAMASILSEEKEKNTLRVLLLSDVKPWEYLLGTGIQIWTMCMLGSSVICIAGSYTPRTSLAFMGIMAAGISLSILVGAAIGALSRNQMMAASISIPLMMVFSFMPMLSYFNTTIAKAAKFVYTEQISILLAHVESWRPEPESIGILAANMLAAAALFSIAYRNSQLTAG